MICQPICAPPQLCSKGGTCVDPGACAVNEDCDGGKVCDGATKICVPGGGCGATKLQADQVPPNFLIVLDRSCSMTAKTGDKTKWQAAVAAITKLTTDYKDQIRFGLSMFPDLQGESCLQDGPIAVPVGPAKEAAIQDVLTQALNVNHKFFPDGPCVTNIDTAMSQAALEPAFAVKDRQSFALLVTDGKQSGSCGGDAKDPETESIIGGMQAQDIGTFVVGFGAATDFTQMDKFAVAGGHPNPDPARDYYLAENEQALYEAFVAIAKQTLGCTFALQEEPPDAGSIYVFFDDTKQILQDKTKQDGWDYDATSKSITFHGPTCEALKSGDVKKLDIVFGCPGGGDTIGIPPGCQSGIGCDALHLCPNDPQKGTGYCSDGCCKFQKIDLSPRGHRERHHEASPGGRGLRLDLPAHLLQQAPAHRQPQPGPLPHRLRRHEGLEERGEDRRVDAWPIVLDLQAHRLALPLRLHHHAPLASGGVRRVVQQVEQHLHQRLATQHDGREVSADLHVQDDVAHLLLRA